MFPWTDPPEPLRFDHFMAAALHDPARGYYARRIRTVGPRGDFSTTATLTPALGRAIAAWATHAMADTRCRDLVELGPGDGSLAAAVLAATPWLKRRRIRLHLVETSGPLREIQRRRLGERVRWHATAAEALAACAGKACLYSNEFADAFPVRRFRRRGEGWLESWALPGEELWRDADALPASSVFARDWPEDQVVEVGESFHHWLRETLPRWRAGRMLTIDYGAEIGGLYLRQPGGSLRGYFHHQLITGPEILDRPGHQDLTADVNFTDLADQAAPWARTTRLESQADFLRPHLDPNDPADHFATAPHGAGDAFLVHEFTCRA